MDKWKNANMPFICLLRRLFVLLIVSVLQPIETRVFINQQHMHFVGTKEKVIQSTSATEVKELPILNRNKKELITTACEQLSSTEGAPTVTRSLVSLRDSFDLELTYFIGRKRGFLCKGHRRHRRP